jgi:hypothetical protein
MFSFLRRELPAVGQVLYPGTIPPPIESLGAFRAPITWIPSNPAAHQIWAVRATHPDWGSADVAANRDGLPITDVVIDHMLALAEEEKALARRGRAAIAVSVTARKADVLRDRKRLLCWLSALMQPDGAVAVDTGSTLLWSQAMLDDELAHDADLDIEALYAIHAVQEGGTANRVSCLHTHGLEELGAFDVDILRPSPTLVANCGDPIRALAFAALEGRVAPATDSFDLAYPGGAVRLVPIDRFHEEAAPEHRGLRDADVAHSGRRSVVCDPARGLLSRWRSRPAPSRYLSELGDQGMIIPFSTAVTELMADRARQTLAVFERLRAEFESLKLPCVVKLGFEVAGGGSTDREHLWFEVHQITRDKIEATLANTPHSVPHLTAGQRGEHGLERLTDWRIMSPEGPMTPRNIGAARRLRASRDEWQARIDAAQRQGSR